MYDLNDPETYGPLLPCEYEDGPGPCYWNAQEMGNGIGTSFIIGFDGEFIETPENCIEGEGWWFIPGYGYEGWNCGPKNEGSYFEGPPYEAEPLPLEPMPETSPLPVPETSPEPMPEPAPAPETSTVTVVTSPPETLAETGPADLALGLFLVGAALVAVGTHLTTRRS